jgi:nicotinamide-nucleotide amidase
MSGWSSERTGELVDGAAAAVTPVDAEDVAVDDVAVAEDVGGDEVAVLAARLHGVLLDRQQTVAVAESLTGGLVAAALTTTAGASATFRGGLVVYATDLKARLAGVPDSLLGRVGAVDPQVALELARGARSRLGATWGVGVTGVAGPDPQDDRPVGTVFVAVVGPRDAGETVSELELAGGRNSIRQQTVAHVVALLLNVAERMSI